MKKGIIFDLDNTLYDYDRCDKIAQIELQEYCEEILHISKNEFVRIYAQAKQDVKQQLGNVGASHNRMLYMQRMLEIMKKNPISYALELYDVYWDVMLQEMMPFNYVMPFFEWLKKENIEIGILTDLTAHIQHRKLRALKISDYVDVIVTSEEAGAEKPDSLPYELIIKKMEIAPNKLIMVGDSSAKDCDGARKCGIEAIHFCESKQNMIVEQLKKMILI